ncbi:ABC transporter permease [Modestobacter italicus]|uniref:ABC transporter permease n=1 Tax=Modestobacter italicus (strain DSM 44449 / CECT 9708 / BC 501) TaxID=2732864 RepID=UPI0003102E9E|nr:ABC transporter permease subunit [Modestobacter marinus]
MTGTSQEVADRTAGAVPPAAGGGPAAPGGRPAPGRRPRAEGGSGGPSGGLARVLVPALLGLVVIGLWYLVSLVVLEPRRQFILPPPHEVVRQAFLDGDSFVELLGPLATTAQVALTGLALAAVLGLLLAMLMSQSRWVEAAVYPYAVALQSIPILALVPLIAFALGYGFGSRLVVVVLICLFPIITNTLFGLHSASEEMHDLFSLHGAGRLVRLRKLQVPAALPATFAGLRISAGMAVVGSIVADFFFRQGKPGIGLQIDIYR